MISDEEKNMIEKFQCPGCSGGCDPDNCDMFKVTRYENQFGGTFQLFYCESQSAGTILSGAGKIALGLPKGFDKVGAISNCLNYDKITTNIRLFLSTPINFYNYLNIPVWAMELDGYLFVRTYSPRINVGYVDIIKGGNLSDLKVSDDNFNVDFPLYDVSKFIDDID